MGALARVRELCYNLATQRRFSHSSVVCWRFLHDRGNALKITTEDLGDRQVMLAVEVDEERVDRAMRGAARRVARDYSIPGFRRGRAPYHVILQRFGREALLQDALEDMLQEVYEETIEAEGLEPYDMGSLEDVQLEPLVLKMRVPLVPIVDLGDYRELRVEPPVVTVDEDEVDAEVERLRQANAILEPAGDRPAELGDWVSLDVNADLGDETLLREEGHETVLDVEAKEFELGFAEQIVGLKTGEEKEFALTLSDDWGEARSGQEAVFTVTLGEVRSRTLPDLDDDLARTVGDFDTLDEMRQSVNDQFEENAQRAADSQYTEEVLEALVDSATTEYPPDVIKDRVDAMLESLEQRLEPQGIALDDYFKVTGQTEEDVRESMSAQAVTSVERGLVLGEFARQENIDVEGDEVEERIAALTTQWGERAGKVREMLSEPDSMRSIAGGVLTDKAVELLVAIAKGEAPPREEVGDESETVVAETKSDDEQGFTEELEAVQAEAEETLEEVGDESETVVAEAKSDDEQGSTEEAEETPVEEFESSQAETEEPLVAEVDSASDAD
jgi:trigger factor